MLNKADYYSKVNAILSDTHNTQLIMKLEDAIKRIGKKSLSNMLFLIINAINLLLGIKII